MVNLQIIIERVCTKLRFVLHCLNPQITCFQEWVWTLTGQNRHNREKVDPGGELQIMLPAQPDKAISGEVCLLAESPFRILRVSQLLI